MHTQPIHLLIGETGLGDYHHEHPMPTATPGEYVFLSTPAKTWCYRIRADVVPVDSGVQALPFAATGTNDLSVPSDGYPRIQILNTSPGPLH